jgi:hypothetical protein
MDLCQTHAWASVGVTNVDGDVVRVWTCENCPAWSKEPLDAERELDWADTKLSEL